MICERGAVESGSASCCICWRLSPITDGNWRIYRPLTDNHEEGNSSSLRYRLFFPQNSIHIAWGGIEWFPVPNIYRRTTSIGGFNVDYGTCRDSVNECVQVLSIWRHDSSCGYMHTIQLETLDACRYRIRLPMPLCWLGGFALSRQTCGGKRAEG